MRVGITTFGCDAGRSGIGQYAIQLIRALAALPGDTTFEVLVHRSERRIFVPDVDRVAAREFSDRLRRPLANVAWHQLALPRVSRRRAYDVLFLPAANRRVPAKAACPTVGTVHDFSSLHIKGKYDALRHVYITRVLPWLMNRLTRVIADSACTKRDVVEFARVPEDRVHVVMLGVDHETYFPRDRETAQALMRQKHRIEPPYVLYISRIEHPGKNHIRLIRAFARIKAVWDLPHRLVFAGSDWTRAQEVHQAAAESACADAIVFTGFFPGGDLPDLYCGADAFVFPSLFEGFGMPILEAMACGVPVACSNVSSLPEVAGDAAALFDPHDEEAISAAMQELLTDPAARDRYIRKGLERSKLFTWQSTAEQTLKIIEQAAEEG